MNGNLEAIAGQQSAPSAVWKATRGAVIVVAGSALLAICAHVSIPLWFTPVPLTLQPFAVLLLGLLLEPRLAAGAMIAYLAEGAAWLPVFTPGVGGMAQLLGPTGGYLLSYPVVAPFISSWLRRGARSFPRTLVIAAVGNLLILALGATWLGLQLTHASMGTLMAHAVLPFLPGDALKVCVAAGIASGLARMARKA